MARRAEQSATAWGDDRTSLFGTPVSERAAGVADQRLAPLIPYLVVFMLVLLVACGARLGMKKGGPGGVRPR